MATPGLTDLRSVLRIPDTLDLNYLRQFNGKDTNVTFDDLARQAATAVLLFNGGLLTGYWSRYVTVTLDAETPDDTGGSGAGLKKLAELTPNAPAGAEDTAHMIPMDDYGRALVWTYFAIRRGSNDKLLRQVRLFIEDAQVSWEKAIMTRLFKSTSDTVGAIGKSVPFADGGTADPSYIPPASSGYVFDNTHTHFQRNLATAAGRDAFLAAGGLHLRHHGINGPFDLVIPEADAALWAALDGTGANHAKWIKPTNDLLATTNIEVRAGFTAGEYIGLIETDRDTFVVATTNRISTLSAGIFKPMGLNNPFNPLKVRFEKGYAQGITLLQDQPGAFPLQNMQGIFTFGVGVNNRLNGVLSYFAASGGYVDATIS